MFQHKHLCFNTLETYRKNRPFGIEIGELPDIEPSALRYFHSFYSHSHLMFERLS